MRFSRSVVGLGAALFLLAAVPVVVAQADGVRSPNDIIDPIFEQVVWVSVAIGGIVWLLIVYALVRFRRRKDSPRDSPNQTHGNNRLEIAWTIAPALVLAWLLVISYNALVAIDGDQRPEPEFMVTAEARQWSWTFIYPDGSESPNLRVQEDVVVGVRVLSFDVIHAFGIIDVPVKVDGIPGRENEVWFVVDEPGEYVIQCYQFCGAAHGDMRATLDVFAAGAQEMPWGEAPGEEPQDAGDGPAQPGGNQTDGNQTGGNQTGGNQTADVQQSVTLSEWAIADTDAPPFVVEAGQTVEFQVRNDGSTIHNFFIGTYGTEGSGERQVLFNSATLKAGESESLFATFDMEEGTVLEVWCDVPGHRGQGMSALLGVGVAPEGEGGGGENPRLPGPSPALAAAALAGAVAFAARRRS